MYVLLTLVIFSLLAWIAEVFVSIRKFKIVAVGWWSRSKVRRVVREEGSKTRRIFVSDK